MITVNQVSISIISWDLVFKTEFFNLKIISGNT